MDALNALSLIPLSVLSDIRKEQPRKLFSIPSSHPLKTSICANLNPNPPTLQHSLATTFNSDLVLLSSVLGTGISKALTYEEALQQSGSTDSGEEFDFSGVINGIVDFGTENPAVLIGGAAILVFPLVLSQVFGGEDKKWSVESAKRAYVKLGEDRNSQLLDIRAPLELRKMGSPDIKGLGKKAISIVYKGEDKPGFLKKLSLKFKEPENTTLFILDKFDGNSELVAELVTANGFKAAYAIKDGAEGPRGWLNSGLPWIQPTAALSLDLGNLTDSISGAIGEGSDALLLPLTLAAATGAGLLAFSEIETILQLLGSVAVIQLVSKRLLFAEDRKQTLQQVDELLNTKVAPKELVDELKQFGIALLPSPVTSKALPAPSETSTETTKLGDTVQKAESAPESTTTEPKVEGVPESTPEINSVPKPEVKAETLPGVSKSLSPYPYYPDLKPPTSPTPSQP